MRTIVGIFNTQSDAEQAVNSFSKLGLEEGSLRVLEGGSARGGGSWLEPLAAAFRGGSSPLSGGLASEGLPDEEAEFYSQALDNDSVLVVADVDDDDYTEALNIIRSAGGETRDRR